MPANNHYRADNRNGNADYIVRPRINKLLANAAANPVVTVCAGAGCGKTRAVADFLHRQGRISFWVRLSERDNSPARFWENYINTVMQYDTLDGERFKKIGFPDTQEKAERVAQLRNDSLTRRPGILVFDDFHLLNEPSVLHYINGMILGGLPADSAIILICRNLPGATVESFQAKGYISDICEADLNFTESELMEYFEKRKLPVDRQSIHEIYEDTKGWAFAINLIARSLKITPNYFGYVKNTLKRNIFKLMEFESWAPLPEPLKHFLASLSLIDRLSAELVESIAGEDDCLLSGLKKQNAYIHFNSYGGVCLIHHLFLDFLRTKQDIVSDEDKRRIYKAAADWSRKNNFKTDALSYYEKVGDYESVVSVLFELPLSLPYDIAQYAKGIFDRAPDEAFEQVKYFAAMHLNVILHLGDVREFCKLAAHYEQNFLALPEDSAMRRGSLCGIYFCLGMMRAAFAYDGNYDFDSYFSKMFDSMTRECFDSSPPFDCPLSAPWINLTYSSEKGAPQKYIEAVKRSEKASARFSNGVTAGADLLIQGELLFYQGKAQAAEPLVVRAMENAAARMSYDILYRALFYLMRIAAAEGNLVKAEIALHKIEELIGEKRYLKRFSSYDIALGWFQYILRQPEKIPKWLTEKFAPHSHLSVAESSGNQVKARYYYLTRNYLDLLFYIGEMKQRESYLLGRVEMLAMEACVHYQMKDKPAAWAALREAYEAAVPNDILMPFIELSKDMRTLATTALREPDFGIPRPWLEVVRSKSSSYSKYHSILISDYRKANGMESIKDLSPREKDLLMDLYKGISRTEIAVNRNLKPSTVNAAIGSIYAKLNAQSITDIIRIVSEQQYL